MPRPLPQCRTQFSPDIDRLVSAPPPALPPAPEPPAQPQPVRIFAPSPNTLYRPIRYDTLSPADQLRATAFFLRSVLARYEENFRIVGECDLQGQDILHKAEMGDDLDALHGYRLYKLLREVRRTRRACKNENDLLRPLVSYLEKHPDLITQLERIQGETAQLQSAIDNRRYTMRTAIFEQEESNG